MSDQESENLVTFVEVSTLRVGSYIVHNERPCRITEINVSKTGKHGAAKAVMTMKDIFTGSKHCTTYSTGEKVQAPVIQIKEYTLVDIDDEEMTVMNDAGDTNTHKTGKHELSRQLELDILSEFEKGKTIEVKIMFAMNDYAVQSFIPK
jgi:translation initiation factor 5A